MGSFPRAIDLSDSPALASRGVGLRAAVEDDVAFLRALFEAARPDAVFIATWPETVRQRFLDQQFQFQTIHYARAHAEADRLLVLQDGQPIGRLILSCSAEDWCIVDISLMPLCRARGIGTLLLQAVQAAAVHARARAIYLTVDCRNPARRLYERLGFVTVDHAMPNIGMAWQTPAIS
jgi:GNAT superfamily N-acetyltransferase